MRPQVAVARCNTMRLTRPLVAALAAAALTPASALAAPPWTTPATIPGAVGFRAELVFTKTGSVTVTSGTPDSLVHARRILRNTPDPRWSDLIAAVVQADAASSD